MAQRFEYDPVDAKNLDRLVRDTLRVIPIVRANPSVDADQKRALTDFEASLKSWQSTAVTSSEWDKEVHYYCLRFMGEMK